ncbi:hypothetical protein B0H14DRAFT_3447970 [Mycena olivaceomarginata]|nr:hypothetical protein B0H14DRAFT_3447970 [Mycena olivaceomarginata]
MLFPLPPSLLPHPPTLAATSRQLPTPASKKQRLAAARQEAAARLPALTSLPPSPTLSQEARDEAFAICLALGTLAAAIGDLSRHPPCLARLLAAPPSSRMSLAACRRATRHCATYYRAASRAHDIDDAALDSASNSPPPCTSSRHTA